MNAVLIGRTIRNLRKKSELSMQALGDKVALSQASISRIERGDSDINFVQLSNICYVFGLTLTDFFSLVENQIDIKLEIPNDVSKSIDDVLINTIQQLSYDQKKALFVLLQPYVK